MDEYRKVVHEFLEVLGSVGSSAERGVVRFDFSRDEKGKDEDDDSTCMWGVVGLCADVDD